MSVDLHTAQELATALGVADDSGAYKRLVRTASPEDCPVRSGTVATRA